MIQRCVPVKKGITANGLRRSCPIPHVCSGCEEGILSSLHHVSTSHQVSHRRYLACLRREFCSKRRKTGVFTSKLGVHSWVYLPLLYSSTLRVQSWVCLPILYSHMFCFPSGVFKAVFKLGVSVTLIHTHS